MQLEAVVDKKKGEVVVGKEGGLDQRPVWKLQFQRHLFILTERLTVLNKNESFSTFSGDIKPSHA